MSLSAWKCRNRKPEVAGDILSRTLRYRKLDNKLLRYSFFLSWKEIVGHEIAHVAYPEKMIRDKILVIRVVDSTWAHKLSIEKARILQSIVEFDPSVTLDDIRFISGNPKDFKKCQ